VLITVSGINVTVTKKKIKHIHLRVKAPDGRVELSVPTGLSRAKIEAFLQDKADWILRQQAKFSTQQGQTAREYVSGETIRLWGQAYELQVVERRRPSVKLEGDKVFLYTKEDSTKEQRERCINEWYRGLLKTEIERLLPKWETVTGLHADEWQVKNMKTRWGTCNTKCRRIWLNLQLAKHSVECLEYVILHELTHLLERGHNERFYAHMDRHMPHWREIRKKLNGQSAGN